MGSHGVLVALMSALALSGVVAAYGHGIGYETLPPQMLGGREVAMEVSSTFDNSTGKKQVTMSLFDTKTGVTLRDVTFALKTSKGGSVLFEGQFETPDGTLVLNLIPDKSQDVMVVETKESAGLFGLLTGAANTNVEARGGVFAEDGLYKFSIGIIAAEGYSGGDAPIRFESGLSFPASASYHLNDDLGHEIRVVSYYDVIDSVRYDPASRQVSFSMPFEWTEDNINQTSNVHEEIFIPKTFTTFQVSKYKITANGQPLDAKALTIDDYVDEYRVLHILLYQADLQELQKSQKSDKIDFTLSADSGDILLADVTDNVQYRIEVTMPTDILRGQTATILFKVYDVFLQGKTVSVDYDFAVVAGRDTVYKTSGTSTDDRAVWNQIQFEVPADSPDVITIRFENLGANGFALAEIPITLTQDVHIIPSWIKNNAGWWCEQSITDDDFLKGIEYLIGRGVIAVDAKKESGMGGRIPGWIRSSSCWWADGSISDTEFVNSIAYLVKNGIIVA